MARQGKCRSKLGKNRGRPVEEIQVSRQATVRQDKCRGKATRDKARAEAKQDKARAEARLN
jgi:hypothetical protein